MGHQLEREQVGRIPLQPLSQDPLEGLVVFLLLEDRAAHMTAIEGVVQPARFVRSRWSWHAPSLTELELECSPLFAHLFSDAPPPTPFGVRALLTPRLTPVKCRRGIRDTPLFLFRKIAMRPVVTDRGMILLP